MLHADIIERIPVPAIIVNEDNQIVSYNRTMGTSLENDINAGENIQEIFTLEEVYDHTQIFSASSGKKTFIFIRNPIPGTKNMLWFGLDTSALSKLEDENKELKDVNRELDAIIENSYDGIYITDRDGVTLKTNSAIERITSIPKEYYIGKNVDALIKRGILENSVTHVVVKEGRTISVVQKNYAGKETLITGTPVFNEKGTVDKVVTNIRDLSDLNELQAELSKVNELNDKYKQEINRLKNKPDQPDGLIVDSRQMKRIFETAERVANIDATVLILGETGVGKDVLAQYIFNHSIRSKGGDFIKINCGAIPPDLLESELFGYEKGAFTGANQKGKPGMFEIADKGMLFLDEIGELPLALQVKLLRVIQEGDIQKIGGTNPKKVDVRIIAATNQNLLEKVKQGDFREDLYYRLNVIPFTLPSLKERKDDILSLAQLFLMQTNEKYGMTKQLGYELKDFFYSYHWPGNIRELSNLIERLVVTTPDEVIDIDNLPSEYDDATNVKMDSTVPLRYAVETTEKKVLSHAVEKYKSSYEIAKALEISQPTVVRKLNKYNLKIK
ncbi:sigma 54-interacting transcriptional regulator [Lentibacillus sp. L22]|uniref:sigma-54 interaction domain-containing protein n=1 Tax=Lentibacillus TaxID=175304 RepID=UPI0022B0A478|nr:sigma 54-interacting transcriptional regulator [Lentibacillus daqui]